MRAGKYWCKEEHAVETNKNKIFKSKCLNSLGSLILWHRTFNPFHTTGLFLYPLKISETLQTHHVYFILKRRGNGRFHVVSTWNTRDEFVGKPLVFWCFEWTRPVTWNGLITTVKEWKNSLPSRYLLVQSWRPLHKKLSFPLRISSVNVTKSAYPQETADLVTFTKEILYGKFHFLHSGRSSVF